VSQSARNQCWGEMNAGTVTDVFQLGPWVTQVAHLKNIRLSFPPQANVEADQWAVLSERTAMTGLVEIPGVLLMSAHRDQVLSPSFDQV